MLDSKNDFMALAATTEVYEDPVQKALLARASVLAEIEQLKKRLTNAIGVAPEAIKTAPLQDAINVLKAEMDSFRKAAQKS